VIIAIHILFTIPSNLSEFKFSDDFSPGRFSHEAESLPQSFFLRHLCQPEFMSILQCLAKGRSRRKTGCSQILSFHVGRFHNPAVILQPLPEKILMVIPMV